MYNIYYIYFVGTFIAAQFIFRFEARDTSVHHLCDRDPFFADDAARDPKSVALGKGGGLGGRRRIPTKIQRGR